MSSTATAILNATNKTEADVTQYAPLVAQAVVQTEAVKATATSSNKAATALGYVMVAAKTAESVPYPPVQAIGALVEMIDDMVEGFNDSGLFSHNKSSTTPAPTPPATGGILAAAAQQQAAAVVPAAGLAVPTAVTIPDIASASTSDLETYVNELQAQLAARGVGVGQATADAAQSVNVQTAHLASATSTKENEGLLGRLFHHEKATGQAATPVVAASKT